MTIVPPHAQTSMTAIVGLIHWGSVSQYGPLMWITFSPLSTMPNGPLKSVRTSTPIATGGVMCGM